MKRDIEQRINELITQRAQLIAQAERQVAAIDGAVAELERVLVALEQQKTPPGGGADDA